MCLYNYFARGTVASIGSVITHLFTLHGLFPQYISDIIGQGWSIGIEVIFYLLVPYIVRRFRYKLDNYVKFIFWNVLCVWILNIVGAKICGFLVPNMDNTFWYLWFPNQLPAFSVGICLYIAIIRKQRIEDWKKSSKYLIGILILVFLNVSQVLTQSLIIAVLILILSKFSSRIIVNSLFKYIGKVSYGIYLFHMLIIFLLQDYGLMNYGDTVSLAVYFLAVPILSIGCGIIAYYSIERPLISLERKIENKFIKPE